jgi:WD40 repeat protein
MSLDQRARAATVSLREGIEREVDPAGLLTSVRRTRTRRRVARVLPAAAVVVAVAAALQLPSADRAQGPTHPPGSTPSLLAEQHANGELVGFDNPALTGPHVPAIAATSSPTWSPDGRELAVLAGGILVTDVRTGSQRRIPCHGCTEIAWSPDGTRFAAVGRDRDDITLVDADTGAAVPLVLPGLSGIHSVTWSPAGDRIAFSAATPDTKSGVLVVRADGRDLSTVLASPLSMATNAPYPVRMAAVSWSSDDRLAVFVVHPVPRRPGRLDLGVMSMSPSGGGLAILGNAGSCTCLGWTPNLVWSPDATTLAVYTQGRARTSTSLDGDGSPVRLAYVRGSGPLAWQPR